MHFSKSLATLLPDNVTTRATLFLYPLQLRYRDCSTGGHQATDNHTRHAAHELSDAKKGIYTSYNAEQIDVIANHHYNEMDAQFRSVAKHLKIYPNFSAS